jgi:N-acetylneuraminate synthase
VRTSFVNLSKTDGGVDSAFSLEPNELKNLCEESERAWQAKGSIHYGPSDQELPSISLRRSLYFVKNLKAGAQLTNEDIKSIRPGLGISPKYYEEIIGKKILKDVSRGQPVSWDVF